MEYNPKSFVYIITVEGYTGDHGENYILPWAFPSRDEARKGLAAEARRRLDHFKMLTLDVGRLDRLDDLVCLTNENYPDDFILFKIRKIGFYNTYDESTGKVQ